MKSTLVAVATTLVVACQFNQATQASNSYSQDSMVSQGYAQLAHGAPTSAAKIFVAVLKNNPSNRTARRYLAHALTQCGQYQSAIDQFQFLSKQVPLQAVDLTSMATAFLQLGNHQSALNCYQQALKLDPNFGPALIGLIKTNLAMSKKDEALALCQKAIAVASDQHSKNELQTILEQFKDNEKGTDSVHGEAAPG